ncbi:DUF6879 family protein [Kitasatospora sp. NPDC091335]|uniref:DUF6879 family protein n=1 Tax=Kitasatospora sp. NPDC091335 TaxID=3364085 RepID=UPI00380F17EE
MLKGEHFGRLFETFKRTAFRLQTLAVYDVDEEREEFADFLAGKGLPAEASDNPWVRAMTDLGKQVARRNGPPATGRHDAGVGRSDFRRTPGPAARPLALTRARGRLSFPAGSGRKFPHVHRSPPTWPLLPCPAGLR